MAKPKKSPLKQDLKEFVETVNKDKPERGGKSVHFGFTKRHR